MKLSALILIALLAASTLCVHAEMNDEGKTFLARKPNPNSEWREIGRGAAKLIHAHWKTDTESAEKIFDHAVILLKAGKDSDSHIDDLFSYVGRPHKESPHSAVLLNGLALKYRCALGFRWSSGALRERFDTLKKKHLEEIGLDRNKKSPKRPPAILKTIQALNAELPADRFFLAQFIFYERFWIRKKDSAALLTWLKQNEKKSLFLELSRHLVELGFIWNGKRPQIPDEHMRYLKATFANPAYPIEQRYYLYTKLNEIMGIFVSPAYANLLMPLLEELLKQKRVDVRDAISGMTILHQTRMDDRWRKLATKFVDVTKEHHTLLNFYYDHYPRLLFSVGQDKEALTLLN